MQAAGAMSERHDDRKTAKVGGMTQCSHDQKSVSVTKFRTSVYHSVVVRRACLTDIRASMLIRAGLLQAFNTFLWASVITDRIPCVHCCHDQTYHLWVLEFDFALACLKLEDVADIFT
jgi:hypothetical protein